MDNIHVAVRVRPFNERERSEKASLRWNINVEDNALSEKSGPSSTYVFDRVYDMDATNLSIFSDFAQPIVASVVEGFHGTIFAYGQTSSGKTYTMMGNQESPGIIPLSLKFIFASIRRNPTREFLLRVSYIEIYNEMITDLLQPEKTHLKIKENAQKEVNVECSEKCLSDVKMALELIAQGEKNRHFGETLMNEKSSRSHTVFSIIVESRETGGDEDHGSERAVKVAKLNLVDLAGSERVAQTGSEGIRLKEGGFINRSLFHLGNVIHRLSERDGGHVPFRESKLTRLLQTSLGGNARTRIICTVTAAAVEETHSTLRFASRAKTIENNAHVNEVLSDGALLQRYRTKITDLQRQIEETGIGELRSENERLALEAQQCYEERTQLTTKITQLERFVLTCKRETRHQGKSKSKAVLRRQTLCPSVLSRHHADDMEPIEEIEEQDSWLLQTTLSLDREMQSGQMRVTLSSSPDLKKRSSVSPSGEMLQFRRSSDSASSDQSMTELEQKVSALQQKLDDKDSEMRAMLNQQCEEKEQIEQLFRDKVKKLETAFEVQKEQLAALQSEKDLLSEKLAASLRMTEQCERLQDEVDSQEVVVSDLEYRLAEMKKQMKEIRDEKESVVGQLEAEKESGREVALMCHELRIQLRDVEDEKSGLLHQLQGIDEKADSDIEILKEELKEATSHCSDLEVERQGKDAEMKKLREKHSAELKSKDEETEQLVQQAFQLVKEKTMECDSLAQSVADLKTQLDGLEKERSFMEAQMLEKRNEVESLKAEKRKAVDITLMEMDKQTIAKEEHSEVEVLKEGLKEATSQCSDLEVERQQRAEELKNLREQHSAELKSKGEETEQLVQQALQLVNEKTMECDSLAQSVSDLNTQLDGLEKERSFMVAQMLEMRNELESLEAEKMKQANEVTSRERAKQVIDEKRKCEIEMLKRQLKETTVWCSDLEAERDESGLKLEDLKQQHVAELKSKDEQIERLVSEAQDVASEIKRIRVDSEQKVQQAVQSVTDKTVEYDNLAQSMAELKSQLDCVEKERDSMERQVVEARRNLENMEEETKKQACVTSGRESDRKATDEELKSELDDLRRQLKGALSQCSDMEFERDEGAANLEDLREQLNITMQEKDGHIERLVGEAQKAASEMKRIIVEGEQQGQPASQLDEDDTLKSDVTKLVEELKTQLGCLRKERDSLQKQLLEARNYFKRDIEKVKTELVARTEQYDALCGEMAELELKEVELNGELKDKDRELAELKKMKIIGCQHYDRVKAELENVQAQLSSSKKEKHQLSQQKTAIEDQFSDLSRQLQNELDISKKELARAVLQSKDLTAENIALEEKLNGYIETNKTGNEELVALRNKLDSAKKENTDLIEVKERLQKECFRVKKECDEMEDELEVLQKSSSLQVQLCAELEHVKRELELAKSNCQSLESERKELLGVVSENRSLKEQLEQCQTNQAGQTASEESKALIERVTTLEQENAHLVEVKDFLRKQCTRVKKECDLMEDELEALQKSRNLQDQVHAELECVKREIEQSLESKRKELLEVVKENKALKEQLERYQRNESGKTITEESKALAERVATLKVGEAEWKQKYQDVSKRLKVEYDARLAKASRELRKLQAENERLRAESGKKQTASMAGDWISNASEAAAYSLRLQRDRLKMDLEDEKTKLDKAQKKALWLEHENKKYQKRAHDLEGEIISLKRELNSKGRGSYVTERASKSAKEDTCREISEPRPMFPCNRDVTAGRFEERLECTGQALMAESSTKPDAQDKCATQ